MTDYYVQVEVGLATSKLVDRGRDALGLDTDQVIGKLVRLWGAAMTARCGLTLGERTDTWIEEAAAWRGQGGVFATFIREHHLDGVAIKDWREKYGKLEALRDTAARIKREQRERKAMEKLGLVDRPVDRPVDKPVDRPRDSGVDSSPLSNLQSVVAVGLEKKIELERAEAFAHDEVHLFTEQYDFGDWGPIVRGFLRSSESPVSVMAELRLHLTGEMRYPKREAKMVGYALNQYIIAEGMVGRGRLKGALFNGFVKRAVGGLAMRTADDTEREEQAKAIERITEEQKPGVSVARYSVDEPERYAQLQAQAESEVDPKIHMGRSILVRARLIELVTEEVENPYANR